MLPAALCILFILGSCCPSDAAWAPQDRKNDSFDFISLVREWPFSFCSVKSCNNTQLLKQQFNIHGLWPDVINGSSSDEPMFCNATFNKSELEPLRADLMKHWMDMLNPNGSALKFWEQEFRKHGSCIVAGSKYNSTYLYFKTALELSEKYNLIEILAKGGIEPRKAPINTSEIRKVIRHNFGFHAQVRCAKKEKNSMAYLYELRLCFTKSLRPRDCNTNHPDAQTASQSKIPDVLNGWVNSNGPLFGLRRLLKATERVFRWVLGWEPTPWTGRPPPNVQEPSGTYECNEGELALMPPSLSKV